ncbi:MAG: hypothetical protein WCO00_02655 [Rhodospirillaceae bacterium]
MSSDPGGKGEGDSRTVYETKLAKVAAKTEDWGMVVTIFGNFEVIAAKTAHDIVSWYCGLTEKYVAIDVRNTLSIDDGALGLILLLKGISTEKQITLAVVCADNPANKIGAAFKRASLDGTLKVYHSLHTFALAAAAGLKQAAAKAG